LNSETLNKDSANVKSQRDIEEVGGPLFASCYLLSVHCYPFPKTDISTAFPLLRITNYKINKIALDIQRN